MLARYRDLLTLKIDTGDSDQHRVSDLLVDDRLALSCIVADFYGWSRSHKAVVRASDFGSPDLHAGVWPSGLKRGDLTPASPQGEADAGEAEALRAASLPAGGCMVSRALAEGAPTGGGSLHPLRQLMGAAVEAPDGEAGRVIDAVLDFETRAVSAAVVETGRRLAEHQRVVPLEMVAGLDWNLPSVRLGCPVRRLVDSPELHEVALDRTWWSAVRAYYGL